jgi:hypothetical protein
MSAQTVRDTTEFKMIIITNSILEAFLFVADTAANSSPEFQQLQFQSPDAFPSSNSGSGRGSGSGSSVSTSPTFYNMYFSKVSDVYEKYQRVRQTLGIHENSSSTGQTTSLAECIENTTKERVAKDEQAMLNQLERCSQLINQNRFYDDLLYLHRRWYLNYCLIKTCEEIEAYAEEYSSRLRREGAGVVDRNFFDMEKGGFVTSTLDTHLQTLLTMLMEVKKRMEYLKSYISVINAFIRFIAKDLPVRSSNNVVELENSLNKKLAFLVSSQGRILVKEMTTNLQRGTNEVLTNPVLTEITERLLSIIRFPIKEYVETSVIEGTTIEVMMKGVIDLELSVDLSLCKDSKLPPVHPVVQDLSKVQISPNLLMSDKYSPMIGQPLPTTTSQDQQQQDMLAMQMQQQQQSPQQQQQPFEMDFFP